MRLVESRLESQACCKALWPAARLLDIVQPHANGPQGRGYKTYPNPTRSTCVRAAAMPALPADAIDAGLRRRDRERHHGRRSGTRAERAGFATTIRAYRWQNALSLVRRVLRDE